MLHTSTHDACAFAVLTPEQSAAIFQKDLANIIAKTRDRTAAPWCWNVDRGAERGYRGRHAHT